MFYRPTASPSSMRKFPTYALAAVEQGKVMLHFRRMQTRSMIATKRKRPCHRINHCLGVTHEGGGRAHDNSSGIGKMPTLSTLNPPTSRIWRCDTPQSPRAFLLAAWSRLYPKLREQWVGSPAGGLVCLRVASEARMPSHYGHAAAVYAAEEEARRGDEACCLHLPVPVGVRSRHLMWRIGCAGCRNAPRAREI